MPLYFAYGSNMDVAAMRRRCPKARVLGTARLARHRFALMGRSGYATVRRDPSRDVHGLLFDLALSDIGPLDRYEDVATGLYTKLNHLVLPAEGRAREALVYIGADETDGGCPPPGYIEDIVDAARGAALPAPYVASLEGFLGRRPTRTGARVPKTFPKTVP